MKHSLNFYVNVILCVQINLVSKDSSLCRLYEKLVDAALELKVFLTHLL